MARRVGSASAVRVWSSVVCIAAFAIIQPWS
jgi:hypothetical protein